MRQYTRYKTTSGVAVPGVYHRDGKLSIGYSRPMEDGERRWKWEIVPENRIADAKRLLAKRKAEVQEGRQEGRSNFHPACRKIPGDSNSKGA